MKTKFTISLIAATFFFFQFDNAAAAITSFSETPAAKNAVSGPGKLESLSGINLVPVKQNGTFQLQFTQELTENGTLELKDESGNTIYTQLLSKDEDYTSKKMNVGRLNSGVYLIEVSTGNKVYWKKLRIRK